MNTPSVRRFVDAWGSMGTLWGINRSVARVHALLMANEDPVSLDEIAERLGISKGNASMSLRELRTFGVVRPVRTPGDRRDYYVAEPDIWAMFFRILAVRKRRELDPAVEAVQALLAGSDVRGPLRARFVEMGELLDSMETVSGQILRSPGTARAAFKVLARLTRRGGSKG
jgi:HTH-type transcriptional regulator, glycine betaine synthesis regulator